MGPFLFYQCEISEMEQVIDVKFENCNQGILNFQNVEKYKKLKIVRTVRTWINKMYLDQISKQSKSAFRGV